MAEDVNCTQDCNKDIVWWAARIIVTIVVVTVRCHDKRIIVGDNGVMGSCGRKCFALCEFSRQGHEHIVTKNDSIYTTHNFIAVPPTQ